MKILNDIRPFRSKEVCAREGAIPTADNEGVYALFYEVKSGSCSTFYGSKCRRPCGADKRTTLQFFKGNTRVQLLTCNNERNLPECTKLERRPIQPALYTDL